MLREAFGAVVKKKVQSSKILVNYKKASQVPNSDVMISGVAL